MTRWLFWASAGAVAVWAGQMAYYWTQDLLVCFPFAKLWR